MKPRDKLNPRAPQFFWVEGLAAVAEYLRFKPKSVVEIHVEKNERRSVEHLLTQLALPPITLIDRQPPQPSALVGRNRLPSSGDRVDSPPPRAPVAAKVFLNAIGHDVLLERVKTRTQDLLLALDHIQDPRNVGAIMRTAAFFGVREVIVPERRQALLTQSAVSTAQGGFALTELVCVVNLARTLRALKDEGYWLLGTAMQGTSPLGLGRKYERSVLVLGAEDTGLSRNVQELCDLLVGVPSTTGLDSLNVSVAAGIMIHALNLTP